MRLTLFAASAFFLLSLPLLAAAQVSDESPFILSVDPRYPSPFGEVVVSPFSDVLNLVNATMVVSVAGKEIYRGNVQPVRVGLGSAGSITSAKVTISSGGSNFSKTVSIQPQDVALIAEPISSAPALYPGKPLVPINGNVRVVAIANLRGTSGAALNPATFSYAWSVDGTQIGSASGIGKGALMVASPLQYRNRTVSVVVTNPDGTLTGGATVSLTPSEPTARIYENSPLLGIRYDRALAGEYAISGSEAALFAAPFSFSTSAGAPLLQWFLNGSETQTGNFITLRPTGAGKGSASLSLVASSGDSKATVSIPLVFGAAGSNFFGL